MQGVCAGETGLGSERKESGGSGFLVLKQSPSIVGDEVAGEESDCAVSSVFRNS